MSNVGVTDLTITDCLFADNTVSDCATPTATSYECGKGAGVFNDGSTVTIEESYFFNNRNTSGFGIGEGGGLANYGVSNIQVISSVFDSNSAGGGAGVQNAELTTTWLENCLFINNSATNGAALNNYDLTGVSPNDVTVTNCTFTSNAASSSGGGIYNHASSPVVKNSIIYGNTPNQVTNIISGSAVISYSDVQGGYAGTNIDADPVFLNTGNDNYRLDDTSPCIDSGDNAAVTTSYDLDDNLRIVDGPDGDSTATVDMGAYEYVGP
jgi:hypothetical protein